ncbi:cell division protein ZipA [Salinicola endophyticus]|uniref:Cell division protein ZipA n=1 Tax=Salinicola endophyticus TaxID=1949083 RepID=A0ABY8FGM6_9GAMM|nr:MULTISPECIES: cell division protein ZipA [Salinicola]WFF41974.1 cell division protein ZipA [Salinicola endophyticus]
MELREWLIILGLVLVATIVIDGFRRLQRQRRVPRLDQAMESSGSDAESHVDPEEEARAAEINWELPNGGARVVRPATFERSSDGAEPIRPAEPKRQERIPDDQIKGGVFGRYKSRTSFADMQENVRSAMKAGAKRVSDSAHRLGQKRDEAAAARDEAAHARAQERLHEEPRLSTAEPAEASDGRQARADTPHLDASRLQITALTPAGEMPAASETPAAAAEAVEVRETADATTFDQAAFDRATQDEEAPRRDVVTTHPAVERAKRHHVSAARARETLSNAEEVIVISVLARTEEGFDGTTLLNLMLACGLRFSEMGIFHRYETEASDSELQFSMVNVLKPGVFDLDKMDEIVTPGVTFLMPLPGANDTAAAFEAMLETAMVLVRHLGGELKDENHSVMTAQTIEFARQRVQEFERRHRLHRYQAN